MDGPNGTCNTGTVIAAVKTKFDVAQRFILDYRHPDSAFWLIFVVQNRDTGRRACRTFSPGRNKRKRLLRTHWLPENNTMTNFSSATAGGRRNLRRARLVSEVPATGRPPGRRNIRRVGRSVVEEKT